MLSKSDDQPRRCASVTPRKTSLISPLTTGCWSERQLNPLCGRASIGGLGWLRSCGGSFKRLEAHTLEDCAQKRANPTLPIREGYRQSARKAFDPTSGTRRNQCERNSARDKNLHTICYNRPMRLHDYAPQPRKQQGRKRDVRGWLVTDRDPSISLRMTGLLGFGEMFVKRQNNGKRGYVMANEGEIFVQTMSLLSMLCDMIRL
jgi:hypothetical protein